MPVLRLEKKTCQKNVFKLPADFSLIFLLVDKEFVSLCYNLINFSACKS
jgi:hypothetical protein